MLCQQIRLSTSPTLTSQCLRIWTSTYYIKLKTQRRKRKATNVATEWFCEQIRKLSLLRLKPPTNAGKPKSQASCKPKVAKLLMATQRSQVATINRHKIAEELWCVAKNAVNICNRDVIMYAEAIFSISCWVCFAFCHLHYGYGSYVYMPSHCLRWLNKLLV